MAVGRALLTDGERELFRGEKGDVSKNYRHSAASEVRRRVREPFVEDLELLREHKPDIYREVLNRVEEHREKDDAHRPTGADP